MSRHMLPLPWPSLFCRHVLASFPPSARKSRQRCIQALQTGEIASVHANQHHQHTSRRRFHASRSKAAVSPSASTSEAMIKPDQPAASSSITHDPNKPRLRSSHELYAISSKVKRLVLFNDETARKLVDAMHLDKKKNLVVLDLYAGSGLLSKHVLSLPNVRQIVGVEDSPSFSPQLHELIETSAGRFIQIALDPFWWDTYRVIGEKGLLKDVKKKPWEQGETNLALIGVIPPNINGERLVMQQVTCIASQMWLYGNGRFNSYFLLPKQYADRIMAPPGSKLRRKLAVIFQSLVDFKEIIPDAELTPYTNHFKGLRARSAKTDYRAIKIIPKVKRDVESSADLEVLEFLTKSFFVHYGSNWVDILKYLAPGADILKDMLKEKKIHIDPKKKARDLTGNDWLALVKVFQEWPFKPENLDQDDLKMALLTADD